MKRVLLVICLLSILFVTIQCQYGNDSRNIVYSSDVLVLTWNEPRQDNAALIGPLLYYQVYYRDYYRDTVDVDWTLIDFVYPASEPEYALHHTDFGNGVYEFAVNAVYQKGFISPLHKSSDATADPFGGWIVMWIITN
jgi:hypothetical protein